MEAISKSRKKAGEALGKMKARGKTFAARKTHRSTADTVGPSGRVNNALRNAVAAVQAENALKKGGRRDKPKMRLLVERLLGMRRWVLGGVIRSPGLAVNPRIAVGTKVFGVVVCRDFPEGLWPRVPGTCVMMRVQNPAPVRAP